MQGLRKVVVLLVGKRFIARVLLNYTTIKKGLTLCNYVSYCNFNVYFINSSGKWSISKGLDSNNDVAMIISENVSTMKLFFFHSWVLFPKLSRYYSAISYQILSSSLTLHIHMTTIAVFLSSPVTSSSLTGQISVP